MYAAFNLWSYQSTFNATVWTLNLLVNKEEGKKCSKNREIVGDYFFFLELNCHAIWRIFLVVNLAAVVDLELIANFG